MGLLFKKLRCIIIRSCLLGMSGTILLSAWIAQAHGSNVDYPPDEYDPAGVKLVEITVGGGHYTPTKHGTKVEFSETYSTQPSSIHYEKNPGKKPGEANTATLHMALARPPYVAFEDMRDGLAFLQITLSEGGKTETHNLPDDILEQIVHPNLFHVEAHMYDSPSFIVTIPYAEEDWRAACIKANQGTQNDPYKEIKISLYSNGDFSYEIKTPTLCHDALLGTGKLAPKAK